MRKLQTFSAEDIKIETLGDPRSEEEREESEIT